MTYQINAILVILSDLPGHSPTYLLTACLSRCFFSRTAVQQLTRFRLTQCMKVTSASRKVIRTSVLSPVHTSNNVEATLSNAISRNESNMLNLFRLCRKDKVSRKTHSPKTATTSKQRLTLSKQHSTLSKESLDLYHSTVLLVLTWPYCRKHSVNKLHFKMPPLVR